MKRLTIGILAHVDAGKTTLSEALLYVSGKIRSLGRVDNKDAYLDTYELERARGITIFSKQAVFQTLDTEIILLDTPGHVDFSAEMERTLQVLDYAILVISGADGVQSHTKTLWQLLQRYNIPVFVFVNKMDQPGVNQAALLEQLKNQLDDGCVDFTETRSEEFFDQVAMCEEALMEEFLNTGAIEESHLTKAIVKRKLFPCYFGSALKLMGVEEFLNGFSAYTTVPTFKDKFGAKVFKIVRDEMGNRLTYLKITGGSLKVRDTLTGISKNDGEEEEGVWEEKVTQLRVYSGNRFTTVNEAEAGMVCAVTGLTYTYPGQGLGEEKASAGPMLEPVLSYEIVLPKGCDPRQMMPKLRQLEEEIPELHILWDEELQEIQAQVMGEVQIEIIQSLIKERFEVEVAFGHGHIVYKETIANVVEGVGHFEPLRHYAEVHVLLEPLPLGSGLKYETYLSEDVLDKNWQRLILTHLGEKEHRGVLTGSPVTDIKFTLVGGRAHTKHTEGGDFRQATYRAVRNGLKQAETVLLEPYYAFQIELPENMVGRAMTDVEKMSGTCGLNQSEQGWAVLSGTAPVVTMKNYQKELTAYTKGQGRLFLNIMGYGPCHNTSEVVERIGYDSERDLRNPTGSVFCAHGSGFYVEWDQVKDYMHVESYLKSRKTEPMEVVNPQPASETEELWIGTEEIDRILDRTYNANRGSKSNWKKQSGNRYISETPRVINSRPAVKKEEYLLVDGYNVIFAWEDLKELVETNVESARGKLLDVMCNYQGIKKCNLIVVFDAYRIQGHQTEILDYHNIHVVYTKEAETADQYIEKYVHEKASNYHITVATSDGLEQIIIRSKGAALLSARELKEEVEQTVANALDAYENKKTPEERKASLGNTVLPPTN